MIYRTEPSNWKDLQDKVAEILNESSIFAESPKIIHSVRNDYEIDVYAKEIINSRDNIILIECKNWNTRVPQTIVHAFRTTLSDIGANAGYIISKKGFQKGAIQAAENTNIQLLTWNEFQDLFENEWRKNYLTEYIEKNWGKLMTAAEYAPADSLISIYGWLLLELKTSPNIFYKDQPRKLPLNQYDEYQMLPEELLNETGFKEIIPLFHKYCDHLLENL